MTKYGRPCGVAPGVENPGDGRMVHQRQRLPLGLKAGDDLGGVHARFDDLQRNLSVHWPSLLREPDFSHPAFAYELEEAVGTIVSLDRAVASDARVSSGSNEPSRPSSGLVTAAPHGRDAADDSPFSRRDENSGDRLEVSFP